MAKKVTFNVSLLYDDESNFRPIAIGCNKSQLFDVLERHLLLAEVNQFVITPIVSESSSPFYEYTL